ncbi:MAG: Na(+)/H(+) antiporter subunit B [Myxococcota bacterium]
MRTPHQTVVIRTTVRLLVPLVQLYALYVVFHGHYSPGGGFQGGVIIAASYILVALGLGEDEFRRRIRERSLATWSGVGVAVFAGVGALSWLYDASFLDYGALSFLAEDPPDRRAMGILLVEIGVAITVASGLLLIFARLFDRPES